MNVNERSNIKRYYSMKLDKKVFITHHVWVFGNFGDYFPAGEEVPGYLVKVGGGFTFHRTDLAQRVFLKSGILIILNTYTFINKQIFVMRWNQIVVRYAL